MPNGAAGALVAASVIGGQEVGGKRIENGGVVLSIDDANVVSIAASAPGREIVSVAVDSLGDVYMTGAYHGTPSDELVDGGRAALPAPAGKETVGFVSKARKSDGKVLWSWALAHDGDGGTEASSGRAVATRGQDVAIGMNFAGAVTYLAGNGGRAPIATTSANGDAFVAALEPGNGRVLRSMRVRGDETQTVNEVALDAEGRITAAGFSRGLGFVAADGDLGTASSATEANGYFAEHGADGTVGGRLIPMTGTEKAFLIVASAALAGLHDVVLCGRYSGLTAIDGQTAITRGKVEGFVARYTNGSLAWLKTFGGALDDDCASVAMAPNGDVVVALNHSSSNVELEPGISLADPSSASQPKGAIVRLAPDGRVIWVRDVVGQGPTRLGRVAVARNDDVFAAGVAKGSIDLGGGLIPIDENQFMFFVVRRSP